MVVFSISYPEDARSQNDNPRLEFPSFSVEAPKGNDWKQTVYGQGKSVGRNEENPTLVWAIFTKSTPSVEELNEPLKVMTTVVITTKKYRAISGDNEELLMNEIRGYEERLRSKSINKNISFRSTHTQISGSVCLWYFATYERQLTTGALSRIYDANMRGLVCVDGSEPGTVIGMDYNESVLQGYSSLSSVEQESTPLLESFLLRKKAEIKNKSDVILSDKERWVKIISELNGCINPFPVTLYKAEGVREFFNVSCENKQMEIQCEFIGPVFVNHNGIPMIKVKGKSYGNQPACWQ